MWSILQKGVVQYFLYLLKKCCAEIFLFDHDLACRTHKIAVFKGGMNFYFMFIYHFFSYIFHHFMLRYMPTFTERFQSLSTERVW